MTRKFLQEEKIRAWCLNFVANAREGGKFDPSSFDELDHDEVEAALEIIAEALFAAVVSTDDEPLPPGSRRTRGPADSILQVISEANHAEEGKA